MANIYIVESPLQFLNALEARHHFADGPHTLLVRTSAAGYPRQEAQMRRLLALFPQAWDRVVTYAGDDWPHDELKRSVYFLLRLLPQQYERVFIGDPTSFIQRFLGLNVRARQLFLLDDGVQSISLQKGPQPVTVPLRGVASPKRKLLRLFQRLPGIHLQARKPLDLFTCFALDRHPGQTVVRHDYAFLRRAVEAAPIVDSNAVYVLGTPMEEYNFVTEASARCLLQWIRERWPSQRIVYVAHRRESDAKLARIRDDYGFEVVAFDLPVEVAFRDQGISPRAIVSFYSSAMFTLGHLYRGATITALRIPPAWLHADHRERILALYRYMEDVSTIDVVDYAADLPEAP